MNGSNTYEKCTATVIKCLNDAFLLHTGPAEHFWRAHTSRITGYVRKTPSRASGDESPVEPVHLSPGCCLQSEPSFISSNVSSFLSSLQIVDDDQVVLTSSADRTVRLWSARGHFIGESHFASVSLLHCHANKINPEVENAVIYGHVHFSNASACERINRGGGVWGKNELFGPFVPMAPPAPHALCCCLVTHKYPSLTVHKASSTSSSTTPYHNEPKEQLLLLCCNNMGS